MKCGACFKAALAAVAASWALCTRAGEEDGYEALKGKIAATCELTREDEWHG